MRRYELVYIFDPALDPGAVAGKLDTFHTALGGEVAKIDHWGARQLAYPIRKSRSGYYVVVRLSASPEGLPEFERLVRLDQETLRYLVVADERLPTSGESILATAHSPQEVAPETEGEAAPGGESGVAVGGDPADAAGQGAESAAAEGGDSDGSDGVAEEGAGEGAGEAAGADAEGAGEEAADGEGTTDGEGLAGRAPGEGDVGEAPRLLARSGPPHYADVRGRGRRRDGPPIVRLNYKDVATLSRFLNDQGKILPKRTTRVTARFQRKLGTAVKRARFLALLPYVRDHAS